MALRNLIAEKNENRHSDYLDDRLSERHLVTTAKRGNSASFESLCAPHRARLLKTAFNITKNREDAEDAFQDSLIRAFLRINGFRGSSSFSTWLTRIVINSALMIRRKNYKRRSAFIDAVCEPGEGPLNIDIPDTAPDPEQTFVAWERKRTLRKAVSHLRPGVRAVVEVGQLKGFSMKETAKVLNISLAATKGRLFQARAELRRSAALRATVQSRTEPAA